MKIVLIGYMGSGKTTIGKLLSSILNLSFYDLDATIENKEKQSIPSIFKSKGEIYFRKKETLVLNKMIASDDSFVLSIGGGTPCFENNLKVLQTSPSVILIYLKANFKTLSNRLFKEKESRPLISHINTKTTLEDFIKKHLFERSYYYSQATHTIAVETLSKERIVEQIVLQLF